MVCGELALLFSASWRHRVLQIDATVIASARRPRHPLVAKGVGESATVGAPAAIVNAVVDALWHLGVRHIDIPIAPPKVWKILRENGVTEKRV